MKTFASNGRKQRFLPVRSREEIFGDKSPAGIRDRDVGRQEDPSCRLRGGIASQCSLVVCLCFHAASDSLSVCRGRCRNRKWRPYWLTPGLSHREQITELRLPLPALRWKIFQLPLSPETCCVPRPRCVSAARADLRSDFSLPESLLQLCDTWRTSCGPFSLLIMVVELNFSYYSTRMDWRLLYILLGLTCWSDRKWNNEVTAWKLWTTGDDNHGLLGC